MSRFKSLAWNEKVAGFLIAAAIPLFVYASVELKSGAGTTKATVDPAYLAIRTSVQPRSKDCYSISGQTGVMAASLGASTSYYAMRISPTGGKTAYVYRAEMQYITQTAGASATNGLSVGLWRGAGAAASGGTATVPVLKDSAGGAASQVAIAQGGDSRIASTAALTVTGITFESTPIYSCYLGHLFAANSSTVCRWDPSADPNSHAVELEAGQVLAWRVGNTAFPATQTWAGIVNVDWCEY